MENPHKWLVVDILNLMVDEDMTANNYNTYLEQKHSKFAVRPEIVKDAIERATGAQNSESRRIIAGEVNEVYEVKTEKGEFVVRVSHGNEDRFTPEKWAIDKAREVGVPAPEVLLVVEAEDKGKKVTVSVETKLSGKPLGELDLSEEDRRVVVQEAGEILARIHSIMPQKFGRLYEGGVGGHESWESHICFGH